MRRGDWLLACLIAANAGATFLPWAASGRAQRSSYALAADVSQLGILRGITAHAAALWPLVALLAGASVFALGVGLGRLGGALATGLGVVTAAAAWAVVASPLRPLNGAWCALAAALACTATGVWRATFPHSWDDPKTIGLTNHDLNDGAP